MRIHPTPERLRHDTACAIIEHAIKSLGEERLRRLLSHVDKSTQICCGERADYYLDAGAACLAFLCEFDSVPLGYVKLTSVDGIPELAQACRAYWRLQGFCEQNCKDLYEDSCLAYDYAVRSLKPRDVRDIIRKVAQNAHSSNA